jgi:hypothetical protein
MYGDNVPVFDSLEPFVQASRGLPGATIATAPSLQRLDAVACKVPGETESGSAGEQPDKG